MSGVRYQVVGADALARSLHTLADGLARDLGPEWAAGSRRLASDASRRAPVLTGRLAGSIVPDGRVDSAGARTDVRYAKAQEGRRHFMRDATAANQAAVVDIVAGGVRRLLGKVRGA